MLCPPFKEEVENKQALEAATLAEKDCEIKRTHGEISTYQASAQCSIPKIKEAFQNINFRYMDLVDSYTKNKNKIAQRIDKNEITEKQGQDELDEIRRTLLDEAKKRNEHNVEFITKKEAVKSTECIELVAAPIWRKYAPNFLDLYYAHAEKDVIIAQDYENNQISYADYQLRIKQEDLIFNNQVRARRALIDARNMQMIAASMQDLGSGMQSMGNAYSNIPSYYPAPTVQPAYVQPNMVNNTYTNNIINQMQQPNPVYVPVPNGGYINQRSDVLGNQTLGR